MIRPVFLVIFLVVCVVIVQESSSAKSNTAVSKSKTEKRDVSTSTKKPAWKTGQKRKLTRRKSLKPKKKSSNIRKTNQPQTIKKAVNKKSIILSKKSSKPVYRIKYDEQRHEIICVNIKSGKGVREKNCPGPIDQRTVDGYCVSNCFANKKTICRPKEKYPSCPKCTVKKLKIGNISKIRQVGMMIKCPKGAKPNSGKCTNVTMCHSGVKDCAECPAKDVKINKVKAICVSMCFKRNEKICRPVKDYPNCKSANCKSMEIFRDEMTGRRIRNRIMVECDKDKKNCKDVKQCSSPDKLCGECNSVERKALGKEKSIKAMCVPKCLGRGEICRKVEDYGTCAAKSCKPKILPDETHLDKAKIGKMISCSKGNKKKCKVVEKCTDKKAFCAECTDEEAKKFEQVVCLYDCLSDKEICRPASEIKECEGLNCKRYSMDKKAVSTKPKGKIVTCIDKSIDAHCQFGCVISDEICRECTDSEIQNLNGFRTTRATTTTTKTTTRLNPYPTAPTTPARKSTFAEYVAQHGRTAFIFPIAFQALTCVGNAAGCQFHPIPCIDDPHCAVLIDPRVAAEIAGYIEDNKGIMLQLRPTPAVVRLNGGCRNGIDCIRFNVNTMQGGAVSTAVKTAVFNYRIANPPQVVV